MSLAAILALAGGAGQTYGQNKKLDRQMQQQEKELALREQQSQQQIKLGEQRAQTERERTAIMEKQSELDREKLDAQAEQFKTANILDATKSIGNSATQLAQQLGPKVALDMARQQADMFVRGGILTQDQADLVFASTKELLDTPGYVQAMIHQSDTNLEAKKDTAEAMKAQVSKEDPEFAFMKKMMNTNNLATWSATAYSDNITDVVTALEQAKAARDTGEYDDSIITPRINALENRKFELLQAQQEAQTKQQEAGFLQGLFDSVANLWYSSPQGQQQLSFQNVQQSTGIMPTSVKPSGQPTQGEKTSNAQSVVDKAFQ